MRKMIFILCIPTALLSACSPSGMQGNPAAVQAGAAIGGVLGAIVGDRAGGYNGSQFRSEEQRLNSSHRCTSRMPSSA